MVSGRCLTSPSLGLGLYFYGRGGWKETYCHAYDPALILEANCAYLSIIESIFSYTDTDYLGKYIHRLQYQPATVTKPNCPHR